MKQLPLQRRYFGYSRPHTSCVSRTSLYTTTAKRLVQPLQEPLSHRPALQRLSAPCTTLLEVHTEVSEKFDTGVARDDHRPVVMKINVDLQPGKDRPILKHTRYDTSELLTAEGRQLFAEALAQFQHPSWDCHPDLHCQQIQDFILAIMDKHFQLPFHQASTWELRDRKQALKSRTRSRRT